MIYPDTVGIHKGAVELRALDRVWIQGRLKMWGRWASYSANPRACGIIENLMRDKTITKTAMNDALRRLKRAGLDKGELLEFFHAMQGKQAISSLVFCTDAEGMKMDRVILDTFGNHPGLMGLIIKRYCYKRTPKSLADDMHEYHQNYSLSTCRRRIDMWFKTAEIMLCQPMFTAFEKKTLHN